MKCADKIGIGVRTGLSRVHHHSDDYVDKKSKLSDKMPDWWISSNWIPFPESDEDDEDNNNNDNIDHNNGNNNNRDDRDDNDNNVSRQMGITA